MSDAPDDNFPSDEEVPHDEDSVPKHGGSGPEDYAAPDSPPVQTGPSGNVNVEGYNADEDDDDYDEDNLGEDDDEVDDDDDSR